MADLLTTEWFDALNHALANAEPVTVEPDARAVRVVIEIPDAPSNGPHALTFTSGPDGARVEAGDHLGADAVVRLSFADATALTDGVIDSASAMRDGRIKVRGDVNAIVPLLSWLQRAHPSAD